MILTGKGKELGRKPFLGRSGPPQFLHHSCSNSLSGCQVTARFSPPVRDTCVLKLASAGGPLTCPRAHITLEDGWEVCTSWEFVYSVSEIRRDRFIAADLSRHEAAYTISECPQDLSRRDTGPYAQLKTMLWSTRRNGGRVPHILNLGNIDGVEWLASCSGCFIHVKGASVPIKWEIGWVPKTVWQFWYKYKCLALDGKFTPIPRSACW